MSKSSNNESLYTLFTIIIKTSKYISIIDKPIKHKIVIKRTSGTVIPAGDVDINKLFNKWSCSNVNCNSICKPKWKFCPYCRMPRFQ